LNGDGKEDGLFGGSKEGKKKQRFIFQVSGFSKVLLQLKSSVF
jgi:hypothetical protein